MVNNNRLNVDFKVFGKEDRGCYYEESFRAIIYLNNHESLDDIYHTITHEVLHHCIRNLKGMDEEHEESLIFAMSWADLSIS